ncbi:DNA mismatch repair protein MutS [Sphingomonas piscis]|uniref:DNA mismatch repair protein MutS n=1 Tax=Sphingomonas piscis TaxID=2714943 RepID=A0A6G7YLP2_9SPHN|nr:Smr/MutS family protein [Sphingomonas piscis]QIK77658.1 DNA mismatch repair protein MutS [Sphingomonas piscis]
MRSLSPEEQALWAKVAETIRPLSRLPRLEQAADPAPSIPPVRPVVRPAAPTPSLAPRKPSIGATLDGTWDRKLRTGQVTPDRTLDLHGFTLDQAWSAIDGLLEDAVGRGDRVLLLITGHVPKGEPPVARGKIRAAAHDWLAASRHASRIAAVRNAHPRHGGGGSLYIILRRG